LYFSTQPDFNSIKIPPLQTLIKAEENLDPGMKEILSASGAEEFGPILAMRGITSKQIVYLRDRELEEVGEPKII